LTCIICAGKLSELMYHLDELDIYRCSICGMVYSKVSTKQKVKYNQPYYHMTLGNHPKLQTFKAVLKGFNPKSKILDIGSGTGEFVGLAKDLGFDIRGIEVAKYALEICHKSGLNVANTALHKIKSKSYDIITLWDVIEHLKRPNYVMKHINRILKKGGLLVLRTPNQRSIFHKIAAIPYNLSDGKHRQATQKIYHKDHLYYFSNTTLHWLLGIHGFRVVRVIGNDQTSVCDSLGITILRWIGKLLSLEHAMLVYAVKR